MRKSLLVLLTTLFVAGGVQAQTVLGYLPEYQLYTNSNICYSKYTDIAYSFMNPTTTGDISYTSDNLYGFNTVLFDGVKANCTQNGIKLWIALGGADTGDQRSTRMSGVAGNATYRAKFVTAVVNFAVANGLEGIDIDWEFPKTSTDIANHKLLVQEFRAKINAVKPSLKLALAVGGEYLTNPNHLQYIDATVFASVDFVNVMTYDFPVGHPSAGVHHSSVTNGIGSITYWNTQKGVPYNKIRLGLPFYGKGSTDRNANGGGMAYSQLKANNSNALNVNNVTVSGTTYYYNSKTELEDKITQGFAKGINGVMIWDMAQDNSACDLSTVVKTKVISTCAAPQPNLGLDVSVCKVGDTKLFDAGVAPGPGNTITWFKDDVLIPGASTQTYTASSAGIYKVTYSTTTCSLSDAAVLSVGSSITTQGTTVCAGLDATVSIVTPSTGTLFSWWDAPTGGTQLATGTRSYTASAVTATKTVYAQEESATTKNFGVGPLTITDNSSAWAQLTKLGQFGHFIDVKQNLTIQSVKAYIAKTFVNGSTVKLVAYNVDGKTVVKSSTPQALTKLTTSNYEQFLITADLVLTPGQYFICLEGTSPSYLLTSNDGLLQTLAQADMTVMDGTTTVMTMQGKSIQRFSASGFINTAPPAGGVSTNYGMLFDIKITTGAAASNCGRAAAVINVNAAANIGLTVVPKVKSVCVGGTLDGAVTLQTSENGISYQAYITTGSPAALVAVGTPIIGNGSNLDFTITNAALTAAAANNSVAVITIKGTKIGCGELALTDTAGIVLNIAPAAPGAITTVTPVCQSASNQALSIAPVAGATSYIWSYSGTGHTFGATTIGTSVTSTISYSASATSGNITVQAVGACGNSAASPAKAIVVNASPSVNPVTPSPICSGAATNIALVSTPTGATFTITSPVFTNANAGSAITSQNPLVQILNTTGTTSGTAVYSVFATVAGCSGATIQITQTVKPKPTVNAVSPAAICSGTATNIALVSTPTGATFAYATPALTGVTGGAAGNASPIVQTLSGSGSAVYSVTATLAGCTGVATAITQPVNAKPATPGAISGLAAIATYPNTSTYSVTPVAGAVSYTWTYAPAANVALPGTGASLSVTFNGGSSSGVMSVTATNSCGTSAASTKSITVDTKVTSVEDNLLANGFAVYPNPSSSEFNLELNEVAEVEVIVYNTLGQVVTSITETTDKLSFGSGFESGIYFAKVSVKGKSSTYKLVKE